jgi:SAM-dependent methyltransferase
MLAQTFSVMGVDISARQIELAQRNVPTARFVQADMTAPDLPPESLDAVVASYSFIHVPRSEHRELFQKIGRWLKPGGILLANFGISNWEEDYVEDWLGAPMFWSSFDADGERAALRSAGFSCSIDQIETEIEDERPLRWMLVFAHT